MPEGVEPIATSIAVVIAVFLAWDKLVRPTKRVIREEIKTQLEIRQHFSDDSEEYHRLTRSIKLHLCHAYPTEKELTKKGKIMEE
jgi:hypothetical protein